MFKCFTPLIVIISDFMNKKLKKHHLLHVLGVTDQEKTLIVLTVFDVFGNEILTIILVFKYSIINISIINFKACLS